MFGGKSLLAVTVIENIGHKCKNDDCEELIPVEDYKRHLETCSLNPRNRIVLCPAPRERCGKEMELSKIYDHITGECTGSMNATMRDAKKQFKFDDPICSTAFPVPAVEGVASKGLAFNCDGSHFYLGVVRLPACTVFSIQHFGNSFECESLL